MESNLATKYGIAKAMQKYIGRLVDDMKHELEDEMTEDYAANGTDRRTIVINGKKYGTVSYVSATEAKKEYTVKDTIAYWDWCEDTHRMVTTRYIHTEKLPDIVWNTLLENYPDAAFESKTPIPVNELGQLIEAGDSVVLEETGEYVPGVSVVAEEPRGRAVVCWKADEGGYLGALDAVKQADVDVVGMLLPGGDD